ncbi:MAG: xanthine dehydrogenase family protein subunit M [Alphaproteobacteria bacterium]|nr:xanthine dehydrogenase family protein subunit M [Alphaproteobacteria bacterium]
MSGFQYEAPATVEAAVGFLAGAKGNARVLAGGTDLLVQLRTGAANPDLVVDIKRIGELRQISGNAASGFVIGAAVTGAEIGEHKELAKAWPGFVEAMELIGSTQIQGRATPGGNLCNASPAGDCTPAMFAAGVVCVIAGPNGRREAPVEQIPTGPGKTSLAKGEFIVAIKLPARAKNSGDAYLRMIPRTEMDIAIVGAGVNLTLDASGACTAARVSLGAVAPTVLLVDAAAKALIGSKVDDAALARLAAAASAACKPIDDKRGTIEYRTKVAGVLARRAAVIARDRARS